MTAKEIEKILKQDGWYVKAIKGSHKHFVNQNKPGKVTVPVHKGDLNPKTYHSILKQAGLE
jgi:predicted RNA binding protein YcfA (HicA-like mRNA interferase family)